MNAVSVDAAPEDDIEKCARSLPPQPLPAPPLPPQVRRRVLRPVPERGFPAFEDDLDRAGLLLAIGRTRAFWSSQPPQRSVELGARRTTADHLLRSLAALEATLAVHGDGASLRAALQARFDLFEAVATDGKPEGTITGYYSPEIPVSARPSSLSVPIHARPADLIKIPPGRGAGFDYGRRRPDGGFEPYFSREEIYRGALRGQGLELLWTPHPTDLLVLQIQGSGWAVFPDGSRRRLFFNGANGRRFRSVGQALIRCGFLPPGTSSPGILAYLKSQPPDREARMVNLNPRYTFLKIGEDSGDPFGASGVRLVDGRSVAVDPDAVPLGLPGFLVSKRPTADRTGRLTGYRGFSRFIFTHDIGSAIRGPTRVDLYWGSGPQAETEAHHMLFPGRMYIFLLKDSPGRIQE
ncbi:MAG: MltA domain-containing protein [Elusimicrobia bacterium]|nr:MltA domain-containing protein [Elusimicrobiota bacterium]